MILIVSYFALLLRCQKGSIFQGGDARFYARLILNRISSLFVVRHFEHACSLRLCLWGISIEWCKSEKCFKIVSPSIMFCFSVRCRSDLAVVAGQVATFFHFNRGKRNSSNRCLSAKFSLPSFFWRPAQRRVRIESPSSSSSSSNRWLFGSPDPSGKVKVPS